LNNTARYFALFREQVGCSSETIEWAGGTAAELFQLVADKHASLTTEAAALVAINDEMAGWETILTEGDEVLFFPPVAGG
jgi:molybdopterin converting factor subunit 1